MSQTTPEDYDHEDGFHVESGLERCPHCKQRYSSNGLYTGPIYDQDGTEYDHYLDSDPMDGPFFCADCWVELDTNRKASEHKSLSEWY